jgi:hypothetical protein
MDRLFVWSGLNGRKKDDLVVDGGDAVFRTINVYSLNPKTSSTTYGYDCFGSVVIGLSGSWFG